MRIAFTCVGCGKRYAKGPELAGRRARCGRCGASFVVPADAPPADEAGVEDEVVDCEAVEPARPPGPTDWVRTQPEPLRPPTPRRRGTAARSALRVAGALAVLSALSGAWHFLRPSAPRPSAPRPPRPAPAAAALPAGPATPFDRASKLLEEQIETYGRLRGLLSSVRDAGSAARVAPKITEEMARLRSLGAQLETIGEMPADQAERLDARFDRALDRAFRAFEAEAARAAALPGVGPALAARADAPPAAATPPPPTAFRAPPPPIAALRPAPARPPDGVSLTIRGVEGRDEADVIRERLGRLGDAGVNASIVATRRGASLVVDWMYPVADPEALAARIDFGKVDRIEGRHLEVTSTLPDDRPELPGSADRIAVALDDLTRPSAARRGEAARALAGSTPRDDGRRAEVSRALAARLEDDEPEVRRLAAEALKAWGTEAAVGPLIGRLDDRDFGVRGAAIEALGEIGDPRALRPLAGLIETPEGTLHARRALVAFGSAAEPAVIERLGSRDNSTVITACSILKEIGGRDALEALRRRTASDSFLQVYAQGAIQAIEARLGAGARR